MHTKKQGPKPELNAGASPAPTDPKSSAFVQEDEWVIPMREDDQGGIELAPDYEPAKTK